MWLKHYLLNDLRSQPQIASIFIPQPINHNICNPFIKLAATSQIKSQVQTSLKEKHVKEILKKKSLLDF